MFQGLSLCYNLRLETGGAFFVVIETEGEVVSNGQIGGDGI